MLNNFIGGGQVFLHRMRMFFQVFYRNLHLSITLGLVFSLIYFSTDLRNLDWDGFISYRKAHFSEGFDGAMNGFRESIGKDPNYQSYIHAKTSILDYGELHTSRILRHKAFIDADEAVLDLFYSILLLATKLFFLCFIGIYLWWSKFGIGLKSEIKNSNSGVILTAKEVKQRLLSMKLASYIKIGNMPIVKDSETKHFLVTGATGSGKTNLFHNILPQIEQNNQPAIVIDQTGEMIAKYYDPERGDIIFNPFDERGSAWDFWKDCSYEEDLERFSKILFGFNRKSSNHNSDPFWEQSAEVIFNESAMKLIKEGNPSIEELTKLVRNTSKKILRARLQDTKASRYLDEDGKTTSSSILSVLATSTKPLSYLWDPKEGDKSFALKEYFAGIKEGSNAWLFLSTKPSVRDITLPLISCLTELALAELLDIGINPSRRLWFVIDELASLKKLPALSTLTTEGRKYGACILAGLQSLNQLYEHYGHHNGSSIFGQFGTNFFFRNNEPEIGRLVSSMCGTESVTKHQKNTSFGANEFRDGVSYNEHTQKKNLIEYSDMASLKTKECFVLFPEPEVRLAKIEVPSAKIKDKNDGFVQKESPDKAQSTVSDNDEAANNAADAEVLDLSTKSVHNSMSSYIEAKNKEEFEK